MDQMQPNVTNHTIPTNQFFYSLLFIRIRLMSLAVVEPLTGGNGTKQNKTPLEKPIKTKQHCVSLL